MSRDRELEIVSAAWERHKKTDGHAAAIGGGSKSGALWSAFLAGWDARLGCDKAAPELLAACKRALVFEKWRHMLGDENKAASLLDTLDKLRVAIAKAEGR